ncbi:MAG TPA: hypothetical protein VIR78_03615 [Malonomonas sp.]
MGTTTNILLLANNPERVVNLSFLLRLSNFETVQIDDDIEAFNYLVQRQNSSQPMQLLLIAEADSNQPILQLLNELEQRNAMLPIVLLQRNGRIPLAKINCHPHLKTMIQQCHSAVTHSYLRSIFAPSPGVPGLVS